MIFYVIGSIIVYFLDHFDKVNSAEADVEETVYEKGADGEILGSKEGEKPE